MLMAQMYRGVGNVFVAVYADDHGGASMYGVGEGPAREGPAASGWLQTIRLAHARVLWRAIQEQATYLEAALSGSAYVGGTNTGDNITECRGRVDHCEMQDWL